MGEKSEFDQAKPEIRIERPPAGESSNQERRDVELEPLKPMGGEPLNQGERLVEPIEDARGGDIRPGVAHNHRKPAALDQSDRAKLWVTAEPVYHVINFGHPIHCGHPG